METKRRLAWHLTPERWRSINNKNAAPAASTGSAVGPLFQRITVSSEVPTGRPKFIAAVRACSCNLWHCGTPGKAGGQWSAHDLRAAGFMRVTGWAPNMATVAGDSLPGHGAARGPAQQSHRCAKVMRDARCWRRSPALRPDGLVRAAAPRCRAASRRACLPTWPRLPWQCCCRSRWSRCGPCRGTRRCP